MLLAVSMFGRALRSMLRDGNVYTSTAGVLDFVPGRVNGSLLGDRDRFDGSSKSWGM